MVLLDEFVSVEIVPGDPLVVRVVVALPFDQVLGPTIANSGIHDCFHLEVLLPIYQGRVGWAVLPATGEWIGGHGEELDYRKYGV